MEPYSHWSQHSAAAPQSGRIIGRPNLRLRRSGKMPPCGKTARNCLMQAEKPTLRAGGKRSTIRNSTG